MPPRGWFPTRIGAQVTDPSDGRPSYTMSTGDYLYKEPDDGVTVAKILATNGDGNDRPFKGQRFNTIYLRVILATTLFSHLADHDAGFRITMPQGYSCVIPSQLNPASGKEELATQYNPWAAPMDLNM